MPIGDWRPTCFQRVLEPPRATSTRTSLIRTDAGDAFVKGLGNPEGPHVLACELVGTQLAEWLGLPVAACAIMQVTDVDEIPLDDHNNVALGPAFVSRLLQDPVQWGGSSAELADLDNPEDITRLVIADTWMLNADRHPPEGMIRDVNRDNVLFAGEGALAGHYRLFAIDHTHCFTNGRAIGPDLANIDNVKDERVYGLFPQFQDHLCMDIARMTANRLAEVDAGLVATMVAHIPREWDVPDSGLEALKSFICRRAAFLAEMMVSILEPHTFTGELFDGDGAGET